MTAHIRSVAELSLARRALASGAALPEGVLREPLRRSWERVRASGMRPSDDILFSHWVSVGDARRLSEAHRDLIELATPDMEHLWQSIRSPHWVVLLTNAQGVIVHSIGESCLAARELSPLRCGRRLCEADMGSTAPGIASIEAEAVAVDGEEHFLDELQNFFCAAAPIFDTSGQLIGVLDVTGIHASGDMRRLDRVINAVQSIECRAYERAKSDMIIRLHEDPRFIGTPAQGVILAREDGIVTSANRAAQAMLGLKGAVPHQPVRIDEWLDVSALGREQMARRSSWTAPVYSHHGARLFVDVRRGAQPRRSPVMAGTALRETRDARLVAAFEKADRVFPHGLPLLLTGETGTGKEWFAQQLHQRHRAGKPFVPVDCSSLAEGIVESELFGHVDGAFTGSRRGGAKGRIEQAQGGTLFLDEIGDMPLHLQSRLLRVLQERRLVRVGGGGEVELDVLVIAATHRDLARLVTEGRFREDLFFRLNGLQIMMPPLREREDIAALIDEVLAACAPSEQAACHIEPELRTRLCALRWPGNVRQLRHVLTVASLLAGGGQEIREEHLPAELLGVAAPPPPSSLEEQQRQSIRRALEMHGGNVSAAARALGVSRTTVYKHLRP